MKFKRYTALFAALLLLMAPSCSNDDSPLTPLTQVSVQNTQATYNSLTFVWDKVTGATQYGYELYDGSENLVVRSVTDQNEVTVTGLKAATEYTMNVWAYAAIGSDMTGSEPTSLKSTTGPLRVLTAPGGIEYDIVGTRYIFSWSAVTDADGYYYTLVNSAGEIVKEGATTSRSTLFSGLEKGEYTFTIKATTTDDSYEPDGKESSVTFTVA
ncbi:MAG: fibronectin type III domain-containing protein [Muribaculaceae bacterium]|nr:fibronectin type III domain-containing protein [Muribaculaceae bacterium]